MACPEDVIVEAGKADVRPRRSSFEGETAPRIRFDQAPQDSALQQPRAMLSQFTRLPIRQVRYLVLLCFHTSFYRHLLICV
jgi:hypothetical protein